MVQGQLNQPHCAPDDSFRRVRVGLRCCSFGDGEHVVDGAELVTKIGDGCGGGARDGCRFRGRVLRANLDTHDTKLRHGDIGTIRSAVRLGPVETQAVSCGARKKGGCTRVLWGGCELRHNPYLRIDCRTYSVRKGKKMSVHPAILVHEISAAWLRNAFAGFLAALVLVLLLILVS